MNDANNAGTLLPCPFCGTYPNPNDPSCVTLDQAYARSEVRPFGCPYFTDSDRKMYPLSTSNAPVEQREAIGLALRRFHQNSCYPQASDGEIDIAIDAILAVRLDEAAIRKDEREKQREIDAKICDEADLISHDPSECRAFIVSAIRNGGKQP